MDYNFKIIHKPGKEHNTADYMSRHPLPVTWTTPSLAEEYINFVLRESTPAQITLENLAQEFNFNPILVEVKDSMRQ